MVRVVSFVLIIEDVVDDNLTTAEDHGSPVSAVLGFAAACFCNSKLTDYTRPV